MKEFEKIMEFFSLSPKERDVKLKDVFEESIEYFERFRHVMVNGSSEEKQQALEEIGRLKDKVQDESKKIQEKTGMSDEDLKQFVQDPKHFQQGQWDALQDAKGKIADGVETFRKEIKGGEGESSSGPVKKKKSKGMKKNKWIQS
ncbi:hypothetical protein COB21_03040 [Candidatus Aerophobetes bacterium]|uniref:Uncharacterized protein n=1 Tax=Aerophobetes bacterium TaxID=2030807 RepID=A0A2A4X4G5_UNCAE|nr:MAG: hypothetical protein COB21_03040 [Candidatus Aerophobetes bacterium]